MKSQNIRNEKTDDLQKIFCTTNFWGLAEDLFRITDPIAKAITKIEDYLLLYC